MHFIFIGGTYRGYKLFLSFIKNNYIPDYTFILEEDDHETIKYSEDFGKLAQENHIPYSIKKRITEKDLKIFRSKIRDFVVICGWRTIIPIKINEYLKFGMIAAHDSLLPAYRGFAPINWCIINGERQTGVTLFKIENGEVDSGPILIQKKVSISKEEYAWEVFEKITNATIDAYFELFTKYLKGLLKIKIQNEGKATYTCKRTPNDGIINWNQSSVQVFNFIRALAPPYPGAFCYYDKTTYIINKARIGTNNTKLYIGSIAGKVIRVFGDGIEVLCKSGTIEILEWINSETGVKENPSISVKSITTTLK